MKNISLFLLFLILGTAISIGYILLNSNTVSKKTSDVKLQTSNIDSFNIADAPKNTLRGKITTLSGDVKWQSRIATEAATINEPITVQQGEDLETGNNGILQLEFEKTAKISISPKSHLSIVQTLPADLVFDQPTGVVDYIKTGTSPLSVRSYSLLVTINDGETNISTDKDKLLITIDVKKGDDIAAFNDLENISNVIPIQEGNVYVFSDERRSLISK